jgi:surfactin synthase thioesterase subunit
MNKVTRLFCVPYAGGSATIYKKWKPYLADSIELIPIELAGRGARMMDPLYSEVKDAVADIFEIIKHKIDTPYAFFGHSMGALLVYELTRTIRENGLREPEHLFFSGRGVPNIRPIKDKNYHLLDDEEFKGRLLELGGTPKEFFEHPELMEVFLPLLRNDFRLASVSYEDREVVPFQCDITVLVGKDEEISASRLVHWKDHTTGQCTIEMFNGGHFFIHDEFQQVSSIINTKLVTNSLRSV